MTTDNIGIVNKEEASTPTDNCDGDKIEQKGGQDQDGVGTKDDILEDQGDDGGAETNTCPLNVDNDSKDSKDSKDADVTFDEILGVLGEFGPYQQVLYFMFAFPYVETAMQLLGWVFVGAIPDHKCYSDSFSNSNDSFSSQSNKGIPKASANLSITDMLKTDYAVAYDIDQTHIVSSAALDWQLFCERSGLHATVGASPMLGYLFGGLIFGTMSDKIGRKMTFLIANAFLLLAGLAGAVAPEYVTFTASRFVVGGTIAGVEASCFVMGKN